MGLFGKAAKAGIAKKVVDEAKKPQNQRKIKDLVGNLTGKDKGKGKGKGGTSPSGDGRRS